ncbi:MAG: hypothetical protein ACLFUO_02315 [Candidatus Woesearchaeota archaeon]
MFDKNDKINIKKRLDSLSVLSMIMIFLLLISMIIFFSDIAKNNQEFHIDSGIHTQETNCSGDQVSKDWCILNLAIKDNIENCEIIFDSNIKAYCNAVIGLKEKHCTEISNTQIKDACYIHLAKEKDKSELCEKTSNIEFCKNHLM